MSTKLLRLVTPDVWARLSRSPVRRETLIAASEIIDSIRSGGEARIRVFAERFGERGPDEPLLLHQAEMQRALDALSDEDRETLLAAADRIERFAKAQRASVQAMTMPIPGGEAGHTIEPVAAAGCYAPAGRYPLPSSVLMTAITARAAGCERVVVASPGAHPLALAAAAVSGADEFLAIGGAHAIAALTFGFQGFARCDVIAGPGNKWVTAAKQLVSGEVGIDMLAGPSELLILADASADPVLVAADLVAQAEHDTDAVPMLVTTDGGIAEAVEDELSRQLEGLETHEVARQALRNGFVSICKSLEACVELTNHIAPEHLEIMTERPEEIALQIRNAGALFVGAQSAEVLGDYGAGPNHTLPTGGTARFQAGLSVMHFLRMRTWLRIEDAAQASSLFAQTRTIARWESLAGHAEAARQRMLS